MQKYIVLKPEIGQFLVDVVHRGSIAKLSEELAEVTERILTSVNGGTPEDLTKQAILIGKISVHRASLDVLTTHLFSHHNVVHDFEMKKFLPKEDDKNG